MHISTLPAALRRGTNDGDVLATHPALGLQAAIRAVGAPTPRRATTTMVATYTARDMHMSNAVVIRCFTDAERVVTAAANVKGGHYDRADSAANPRSDVGSVIAVNVAGRKPDAIEPHESQVILSSTVGREVRRGAWRRPHEHLTRRALAGLVLWWFVMAALVIAAAVYVYVLYQV
jgi:hypothetical protein